MQHLDTIESLDAYLAAHVKPKGARYPFKEMKVGQRFEVDMRDAAGARSGARYAKAKNPGRDYVTHREGDKLVVVRIA